MPRKIDDNYLYYKKQKSQQHLSEQLHDNDFYDDDDVTDLTEMFKEYLD